MKRRTCSLVVAALACGTLLTTSVSAQEAVAGYPNPFGGRWTLELDTAGSGVSAEAVSIGLFLADTMFFGEFVVRPELAPLAFVVPSDLECSWDQEDFLGRLYEDRRQEPILNFLELYGGDEASDCMIEMRLVAKPDATFGGWWCQGSWSDCRRQGPASLYREN